MSHPPSPEEAHLWQLIEARNAPGADREAIEAQIWRDFGTRRAILFTDLSGFSRQVADFGIVHFLAVIAHKRRLLVPIIEAHGGRVVKVEADSFLVVFEEAEQALTATLTMREATWKVNESLAPESQLLLCCGLGYGEVLEVGRSDVWGREVNAASKLGEDTARTDEILVTGNFKRAISGQGDRRFARIDGVAAAPDAWEWLPR